MKYLIVFAHPEPERSFNAAMLRDGVSALMAAGHECIVSDLYGMDFDPVASARDFATRRFPDRLHYDREQKAAAAGGGLAADVQEELDKLLWCEALVLQFPLWWFSMPAMLKGWIDRVFVNSVVYGAGKRYETGGLAGRRAMLAISTGAYEAMFRPDGLLGGLDRALWPIHNGILHYSGFEVVRPHIAWSPVYNVPAEVDECRRGYADRLLAMATDPILPFHAQSDFDAAFRLRPDVVPRSVGHWRPLQEDSHRAGMQS